MEKQMQKMQAMFIFISTFMFYFVWGNLQRIHCSGCEYGLIISALSGFVQRILKDFYNLAVLSKYQVKILSVIFCNLFSTFYDFFVCNPETVAIHTEKVYNMFNTIHKELTHE